MRIRPANETTQWRVLDWDSADYDEPVDQVEYDFSHLLSAGMSRRRFVQVLGAGLLVTVALDSAAPAQEALVRVAPQRDGSAP